MGNVVEMKPRFDGALMPLPHNDEAERALLAAILHKNSAYESVAGFLQPVHFYVPENARLYDLMKGALDQGQPANPVTLQTVAAADPILSAVGGMQFLAGVAASLVTTLNAEHYGRVVLDLYQKRLIIEACRATIHDCYEADLETPAAKIVEGLDARTNQTIDDQGEAATNIVAFGEAMNESLDEWEKFEKTGDIGTPSGLIDLDRVMGTMQPQDLILIAGRPSMGKTALAKTMAVNAAEREVRNGTNRAVVFFSLEMSRVQMVNRIITAKTGILPPRRRQGPLTDDDWGKLVDLSTRMHGIPLIIDAPPASTLSGIKAFTRRVKRKFGGLALVVVDYLQLLRPERGLRFGSRVEEVTYYSVGLKQLARYLDVPVLALSQLSREVEKREDKRPQLSDLRDSGSLEQDADTVVFAFREYYYLERQVISRRDGEDEGAFLSRMAAHDQRKEAAKNKAEAILAKARHGSTGLVELHFDGERTWFSNLEHHHIDDGSFG